MKQLLANQSEDIGTPTAIADSNYMETVGAGSILFHVIGDYDGAALNVYMSTNTFNDGVLLSELTFVISSIQLVLIDVPAGIAIWAEVVGASVETDLTLNVAGPGL